MVMRKMLLLAAGLLIAGNVAAEARPAVVTADLNIRSGPGTNYRVIGTLPAGARVDVGGCTGSWCRVAGGYASARYLSGSGVQEVVVNPGYNAAAVGFGAAALGIAAGAAWNDGYWGPGWGGGYWGRPYWGPRPGYWGPRRAYWGPRPGQWGPRPGQWGPGRPAYWRHGPGWGDGPRYNQFRNSHPNYQPRMYRSGYQGRYYGGGRQFGGGRPIYRPMGGGGGHIGGGFRGR